MVHLGTIDCIVLLFSCTIEHQWLLQQNHLHRWVIAKCIIHINGFFEIGFITPYGNIIQQVVNLINKIVIHNRHRIMMLPSVIYTKRVKRFNANVQQVCFRTLKSFQQMMHERFFSMDTNVFHLKDNLYFPLSKSWLIHQQDTMVHCIHKNLTKMNH